MPFDAKGEYVKPVPRAERLMDHLKKAFPEDTTSFHDIMQETIDWLCVELDSMEQRLDFFQDTKADKREPRFQRRPNIHLRGVRD